MKDIKIKRTVNLKIDGGAASVAFPIGPTLAQYNVKAADFAKAFNDVTASWKEFEFPVEVIIYKSNEFEIVVKSPSTTYLINALKKPVSGDNDKYYITLTDIYNIAKLKSSFKYILLKPCVKMILSLVRALKIDIKNE